MTMETTELPLTALDRCDRCGAQAYVRATLEAGTELLFCSHHWGEHGDKVKEIAAHVRDETEKLLPPVAPAAPST